MKTVSVLLIALLLFSHCGKEEQDIPDEKKGKETLFFIIAANSNLRNEADKKVEALLHAASHNQDIFVLKETYSGEGCLFLHRVSVKTDTLMCSYNSSFQENIRKSIDYIARQRPENVSLIIFSHATGWYPSEKALTRSAIIDDYTDLSLEDLYESISGLSYRTIIFESCNMGSIECLYQFHDICDYIIASSTELLSPGFMLAYQQGIKKLTDGEGTTSFAQQYVRSIERSSPPYNSCALSVYQTVDAHELFAFCKRIREMEQIKVDVGRVQKLSREGETELFYDLESYFHHCNIPGDLQQELHRILDKIVIYKYNTKTFLLPYRGFYIDSYCGLSIFDYLSPSADTPSYKKTCWGRFLF